MEKPRTKDFSAILTNLKLDNQKVLLVIPGINKNIYLSARNLPKNKVVTAAELNTYDVLNAQKLVLVEGSVAVIENTLLK